MKISKDLKEKIIISVLVVVFVGVLYLFLKPSKYEVEIEKAYAIKRAHPELTSFDGFDEPAIPDKVENEKTLLGVDANKNGLRDDVEIWINRTQSDPRIRNALRQRHLVFQEIMTVKTDLDDRFKNAKLDREKAESLFQNLSDADRCLISYFEKHDEFRKIEGHFDHIQKKLKSRKIQFLKAFDQVIGPIEVTVNNSAEDTKSYCKLR